MQLSSASRKDSVKKHDKFIAKHELGVILVSDEDNDTCERYGTWVEKSMYGKKYMGIERSTFVIGGDGKLTHVWRKVKVPGHAEAVLEAVKGPGSRPASGPWCGRLAAVARARPAPGRCPRRTGPKGVFHPLGTPPRGIFETKMYGICDR